MPAKQFFLVTDMDFNAYDQEGLAREVHTEKAALKKATELLSTSVDDEVWVWKLSHVISRPDLKPVIDKVDE